MVSLSADGNSDPVEQSAGDDVPERAAKSSLIAAMAHTVTILLLGNPRFEAVMGCVGGSALPAGISNLITPMSSLLTVVDAGADPVKVNLASALSYKQPLTSFLSMLS